MGKGDAHQRYQVLANWCDTEAKKLTWTIGSDESREGGNKFARLAVTELCKSLSQIDLGEFIEDIEIDSYRTARQAVALLSKWKKDLTQRYEDAERIAEAERQRQADEKAASIARRVAAAKVREANIPPIEQEQTEDERLDSQSAAVLAANGIHGVSMSELSRERKMHLVWYGWQQAIELQPAKIRDKWTAEFPSYPLNAAKKVAAGNVRKGLTRIAEWIQKQKS